MPPSPKRDVGVVFFDVHSTDLLEGLLKFVAWEVTNTKDEHRLFLANVTETDNVKDLPHLALVPGSLKELGVKEVQQCVQQAHTTEQNALNLYDMLNLAIYHLNQFQNATGVITRQIIIFSNLRNVLPMEEALLERLINRISALEIYVYIVGPDVSFIEPVRGEHFFDESYPDKIVLNTSTPGLEQAKKLVCGVYGVMADLKVGLHLLLTYRKTAGSQAWKVPLTIGNNIEIAVNTSKVYRKDANIKVKKEKIGDVPSCEQRFTLADDVSVAVDMQDTVRGLSLHNRFVEIRNDSEIFQSNTVPTFDIICFAPAENVPLPYMIGGESFIVLPEQTSSAKRLLFFNTLVDVLVKQKKYAIVSRVYIRKTQPKYFVLIPVDDAVPKRFMMTEIGTGDEIKEVLRFRYPDKPRIEVDPKIREFIKSMDVTNVDGDKKVALEPTMMMSWLDSKVLDLIVQEECGIEVDS